MKVLIVAGGTGGHVYPALSIAEELHKNGNSISWIGKKGSLEERLSKTRGFDFFSIRGSGFLGKGLIAKINSIYLLIVSAIKSIFYLLSIRPDVIISTGGYLSLAPSFIGSFVCPLIIHEQNSVAGISNRILHTRSKMSFEAFPDTFQTNKNKVSWVGNPVRKEIIISAEKSLSNSSHFTILVLGGSQGSQQINDILCKAFENKNPPSRWRIIHQVGNLETDSLSSVYSIAGINFEIRKYIEDMGDAYGQADVVISRSGAMTITEICAVKKPCILLPLPWSADDHQYKNALFLKNKGAAEIIKSEINNSEHLFELLIDLENDHNKREYMAYASGKVFPKSSSEEIYRIINESL